MSTHQDVEFYLGEHWPIDFIVEDGNGDVVDISSGTLQFRLSTLAGVTVMTRTSGDGLAIVDGPAGECSLRVTPTQQTSAAVAASTTYQWQFRVTTSGGTVSNQAHGALVVHPSLF